MPAVIAGSEEDIITSEVGTTRTNEVAEADWLGLPLSVIVALKVAVPLVVGVPETMPVDCPRLRPAGNLPEAIDHRYGVVPPLACKACEYDSPTLTSGSAVGFMTKGVGLTIMAFVTDADIIGILLSVTFATNAAVPLVVGVPEMAPVDDVSTNPLGNCPEAIVQM